MSNPNPLHKIGAALQIASKPIPIPDMDISDSPMMDVGLFMAVANLTARINLPDHPNDTESVLEGPLCPRKENVLDLVTHRDVQRESWVGTVKVACELLQEFVPGLILA